MTSRDPRERFSRTLSVYYRGAVTRANERIPVQTTGPRFTLPVEFPFDNATELSIPDRVGQIWRREHICKMLASLRQMQEVAEDLPALQGQWIAMQATAIAMDVADFMATVHDLRSWRYDEDTRGDREWADLDD